MVGNKSPSPALTFQGMLANSVRHDPMTNEVGRKKTSAFAKKNDALPSTQASVVSFKGFLQAIVRVR